MAWSVKTATAATIGIALTGALNGCVMKEQYEAEKSRAVNFQRLLAQEEKRTGELDAEVKRLRRDVPELDARNRELTAQLQAVREQLGRVQEENAALREAAALQAREETPREPADAKKSPRAKGAPKTPPPPVSLDKLPADTMPGFEGRLGVGSPTESAGTYQGEPVYHSVKRGDTLFRLARQYGKSVTQIKEWNQLSDDMLEIGQRLIVGYQ